MKRITLLLRLSRPILILGVTLQYFLGLAVTRYFRVPLHLVPVFLGGAVVLGITLAGSFFFALFDSMPHESLSGWLSVFLGRGKLIGQSEEQLPPKIPMMLAVISLITAGLAVFYLLIQGWLTPIAIALILLLVICMLLYVLPVFQVTYSGFGELIFAIAWTSVIPSLAYVLLAGSLHRFLILVSLPSLLLLLCVALVVSLPSYGVAEKFEKRNLLVRIGWKNGFLVHNSFLIISFILIGLSSIFDLPMRIILPAFLVLPLVGLQIWYLHQIEEGRQPNWSALLGNSLTIYAATVYLLAYSLWIG